MKPLIADELAKLEYEALQAEKRDRISARLQTWSIFLALVGAFGLASVQSGEVSYVVALFPVLAACLARYAGHSEMIVDRIKVYLLSIESENSYAGYEHYTVHRSGTRRSGGHKRAMRDAIVFTDLLATAVIIARLVTDHQVFAALIVATTELVAIAATWKWLKD